MDLTKYGESAPELRRSEQLIQLIPSGGGFALDVGAQDGYFSRLLVERFSSVTAVDLEKPSIVHPNIKCQKGDVTGLHFDDNSFDFVFCAGVLEHVPAPLLGKACSELSRVSKKYLLIGVPYKQDIRVWRTTCCSCGRKNPAWGHASIFDENRLEQLFPGFEIAKISFVGETDAATNFLSTFFMDLAGNPYGTYNQEAPCIHCGGKLKTPPDRGFLGKVFTSAAFYSRNATKAFVNPHPIWIHMLLNKHVNPIGAFYRRFVQAMYLV